MDTDIASESLPDMTDKGEEGELSDLDLSLTDADQALSEEQNYWETAWH